MTTTATSTADATFPNALVNLGGDDAIPFFADQGWMYGFIGLGEFVNRGVPSAVAASFYQDMMNWTPSVLPDYNPQQWVHASRAVFCRHAEGPTTNELIASLPFPAACSGGDPFAYTVVRFRRVWVNTDRLRPEDRSLAQAEFYVFHPIPLPIPPTRPSADNSANPIDVTTAYYSLPREQVAARLDIVSRVARLQVPEDGQGATTVIIHNKKPSHDVDGPLFPDAYANELAAITNAVLRDEDNALLDAATHAVLGRFVQKHLMVSANFCGQMFYRAWTDQVLSQLPAELFQDTTRRYIVANKFAADEIGDTFVGYTWVWEAL